MQDKNGFLWFLTYDGLDRYDGCTFKNYSYSPEHSDYIMPGWFCGMDQDSSGVIWIGDSNAGIYSFDPLTEVFTHYVHQQGNENSLSADLIFGLVIDKGEHIWIPTVNGLNELNPHTGIFKHYFHKQGDSTTISNNSLMSICTDEKNNLWVLTISPGIDYFNPLTGKVMRHFNYGSTSLLTTDFYSSGIQVDKGRNGNIWIGSRDNGLFCFNTRTISADHFPHHQTDPYSISDSVVLNTFEDSEGNYWIGMGSGGMDYYDHTTRKFFYFNEIKSLSSSLGTVYQVLEDRSHKIWIACDNGIFTVDPENKKFKRYKHLDGDAHSLSDNFVSSFCRNNQGQFYIGTSNVDLADDSLKGFHRLPLFENGRDILENSFVWKIYEDRKKILWFATGAGLASYDPVTKRHRWYVYDSRDSTAMSAASVTGIIEDRKGRYWITTWGGGFDAFDPNTGKFRTFKVHDGANSISTNNVGGLFEDFQGTLYMGTANGGLVTFNPDSETFRIYRHSANEPSSISCDFISGSFVEAKSGIIWFATQGGGVNAFDPSSGKFKAFTTKHGLSTNDVMTIVEDNKGNYWLGLFKGISCFTPPKDPFDSKCKIHFRNYNASDGLPADDISPFGTYKDTDGRIFFGTNREGMFCFYPDDLKDNNYLPPVIVTDFKLFNQSVNANDSTHLLPSQIENTQQIKLTYRQNTISFTFAALNYIHPEKNQYAYKLDGFDKDWIYTDATKRFANYTNLNAGEYTFRVKGSNNDGAWNEAPATIRLIITPPFWQTWWCRALMILTAILLVFGIFRYRLQEVIHLQTIRNKIAGDLHDEIGSTLNSISIYTEVVKKKLPQEMPELQLIGEASRKVIDAMSDIVWTINPENDSLDKIIFRMRSLVHGLMKAKKIEYIFEANENMNDLKLPMITRKNFYLIFKEAMNNLVKYSSATRAFISLNTSERGIELLIQDNGIGFDMNEASRGNGILNMNRRAKEIKAELSIESTVGIGTSLELILRKK